MQCNISQKNLPSIDHSRSDRHLDGENLKIGTVYTALCEKGLRHHTQVCQPLQLYMCGPVRRHECKAVSNSCVLILKLIFMHISTSMYILTHLRTVS